MPKILIVGDNCSYNLNLITHFVETLSRDFELIFCLDFSISIKAINTCLTNNISLKALTTRKDLKKNFGVDYRVKNHCLYVRSVHSNYYNRVSFCYKAGIDIADCVLFLTFSNNSLLFQVAEYSMEQGKLMFCIPGEISNKYCSGSNFLLKTNNAIFIENPNEILNYVKE